MTTAESAFNRIWALCPGRRTRSATLWWIFVLFPKQHGGYGPKQMMWGLIGRGCELLRINGRSHRGLAGRRAIPRGDEGARGGPGQSGLPLTAVGWIHDGSKLHEEIVHAPCEASLSEGSLVATSDDPTARGGARITAIQGGRPLSMRVRFEGARGGADFEAWGDEASPITSPFEGVDPRARLVHAHAVTLRKIQFDGEFSHPGGAERLAGCGYFQRYCLDLPVIPWKWIWALFQDGSVFSCFVPYLGIRGPLRGGGGGAERSVPGPLERAALRAGLATGYFNRGGSRDIVDLGSALITPLEDDGVHPRFAVEARSLRGDFIRFVAAPYGASRLVFERPILQGVETRYCYNEYCFRVEGLEGRVGRSLLGPADLGEGFGSCEYTWGIGL